MQKAQSLKALKALPLAFCVLLILAKITSKTKISTLAKITSKTKITTFAKTATLVAFLGFASLAKAAIYDLETLKNKENSIAKDYYIHRLFELNQITKAQAQGLLPHIWRNKGKIQKALEALVPPKKSVNKRFAECFIYTTQTILDANATCRTHRVNFSLYFAAKLDPKTRAKLLKDLKDERALLVLRAFETPKPLKYIVDNNNTKLFLPMWEYLNKPDINLNKSYADKLAKERGFTDFARAIIIKRTKHPNLKRSFLNISPTATSGELAFYLGVNALTYNVPSKALPYFNIAYKSLEKQADKDNALFWIYTLTQKENYLKDLANSDSLNIYSIYAREKLGQKLVNFSTLKAAKAHKDFDMGDPFLWQSTQRRIQRASKAELDTMARDFNGTNTLPIYAMITERQNNFKKNFFIMPYFEHIKDYDKARQALILAIARQESRFIPTAISTSYALGMMQFMPYVANAIAKDELKLEKFDQDDMFEPKTAYFFANHHLDYLEKHLASPILIAYAYNGGITFTKRMLDEVGLFKAGKYEPFLSMELIHYTESRIYAKKVLANYVIYRHLLGDKTEISSIFESLIQRTGSQNKAAN